MEVYIYSHHLTGGLYVVDYRLDDDTIYCRNCGDSDWLEFHSDDIWEVKEWLRSQLDVFGLGGYSEEYLNEVLKKCEDILGDE